MAVSRKRQPAPAAGDVEAGPAAAPTDDLDGLDERARDRVRALREERLGYEARLRMIDEQIAALVEGV